MPHLTRYYMYKKIKEFFKKERKGQVLCISGAGYIADLFHPDSEIISTNYPSIDIHKLPFNDNQFDFVLADQVLEHIENPFQAVTEIHRVLKEKGWAIITTCLMNPLHESPKDYWRFTPDGLKILCKKFSEFFQCEGWGNKEALDLVINKGMRMEKIFQNTALEKIAMKNDNENLIVTWIIAKK